MQKAPLEERVLSEQALMFVTRDAAAMGLDAELAAMTFGDNGNRGIISSSSKRHWSYVFRLDSSTEENKALLDNFQRQLVADLEIAGAAVILQEQIKGQTPHVGFKIEYSKSKVTGKIQVTYRVEESGLNVFEVFQGEDQ